MITMTFALKNSEKTITKETMQECVSTFVKEFEEAEQELQLRSVETILIESAMSKKQISHLKVSIEKKSKLKN